ncbi:hypothetical protein L5D93_23305 [Paenibacillus thiaminolyticus]|nr:hypothetical protein [Paenibacillus thiaminolyticus]
MAKFIELKGTYEREYLNVATINFIFEYEGKAIIHFNRKYMPSQMDYHLLVKALIYNGFVGTEFNGTTIEATGIETKYKIVKAYVNLDAIKHIYGSYHGQVEFTDGTVVESSFSPGRTIISLGIENHLALNPFEDN